MGCIHLAIYKTRFMDNWGVSFLTHRKSEYWYLLIIIPTHLLYHYLFCFQLKSPALAVLADNQGFVDYPKKIVIIEAVFFQHRTLYTQLCSSSTAGSYNLPRVGQQLYLSSFSNCPLFSKFLSTKVMVFYVPGMYK